MEDISGRSTEKLIIKKEKVLGRIYSRAYLKIIKIIESNSGTLWRQDRSRRMLANLNEVLKTLDKETASFIKKEIPVFYKEIAESAKYDLSVSGVPIKDGFSKIHTEAISNISEESRIRFAEGMAGVKRDVLQKINVARKTKIRETIGVGQTLGKAQDVIADEVKDSLKEEGITSLVDRAGKKWKLDNYARMLTGEMLANTSREAVTNIGLENGFDVYRITRHGAKDACRFHEGKLFSMTGKTPGLPTFEDLKASGEIFHVGCRHSYSIVSDYEPGGNKTEKETAKRLKSGKKISNYDAKKNPGASENKTLEKQEKRKEILKKN